MADFIVMTGAWPNVHRCSAERVPVAGETFEIEGSEWTVGVVSWSSNASDATTYHMKATVSLYKDPEKGQR